MVLRPLSHVSDEPGAHRHLGAHQLLAGTALGQPAAQHVALGDPERPALGPQRGEHPLEDPGQQLVEIEGRAELQADGMQQPEALDLLAQLLGGRGRGAQDVGHGSGCRGFRAWTASGYARHLGSRTPMGPAPERRCFRNWIDARSALLDVAVAGAIRSSSSSTDSSTASASFPVAFRTCDFCSSVSLIRNCSFGFDMPVLLRVWRVVASDVTEVSPRSLLP